MASNKAIWLPSIFGWDYQLELVSSNGTYSRYTYEDDSIIIVLDDPKHNHYSTWLKVIDKSSNCRLVALSSTIDDCVNDLHDKYRIFQHLNQNG